MEFSDILNIMGSLLYPLLLLSVLALFFIFERGIFFILLGKRKGADDLAILKNALSTNKDLSKDLRDEIMSFYLVNLQESYEKGIRFMRMLAAIAPMLGLLGTVIGMIDSFEVISLSNEPVAPAQIAASMKLAMFTTAYGLIIAIPCLFFAYLYTRISERRIAFFQKELNQKSLEIDGAKIA